MNMISNALTVKHSKIEYRKFIFICILFFFGAISGSYIVSLLPYDVAVNALETVNLSGDNFIKGFFGFCKYHIFIFIFSLSALGVIFIPAIVYLKGFTLSFTSGCIFYAADKLVFSSHFTAFFFSELISTVILVVYVYTSIISSCALLSGVFSKGISFRRESVFDCLKCGTLFFVILFAFYIFYFFTFK